MSGWGPLDDVDQWEGATWHLAAEVAQSGAATWHRLGEVVTVLEGSFGSPSCTQSVFCPQVVPREALIKSQPFDLPI
jgi:hypothetical protein